MEIIKLKANAKEYIWGSEYWVLSSHKEGNSVIDGGSCDGMNFGEYLKKEHICENPDEFPILVKIIETHDRLSVQVHPDNSYAREYENDNGKTEMWYICDCSAESSIIYGLKDGITKRGFTDLLQSGKVSEAANTVNVKKGDVFFIEPGTVHAIGENMLIAEIQQNSNITYRIYDYERRDRNGMPRQLQTDKALDVINFNAENSRFTQPPLEELPDGNMKKLLSHCEYFTAYYYKLCNTLDFTANNSGFINLLILDGEGFLDDMEIKTGDSFFIPPNYGKFKLAGNLSLIVCSAPL